MPRPRVPPSPRVGKIAKAQEFGVGRTLVRVVVASVFLFIPEAGVPIFLNLVLPFLPAGSEITTSGRHDDAGDTWFFCKRLTLMLITVGHCVVLYTLWCYRDKAMRASLGTRYEVRANKTKASERAADSGKWLRAVCQSSLSVVFFKLAWDLYLVAPPSLLDCSDETNEEFAAQLYLVFVCLMAEQIVSSIVFVYVTGQRLTLALQHQPPTYFLYWLVVVYCPLGDTWLFFSMECARVGLRMVEITLRRTDPTKLLLPLTMLAEALHFAFTVYTSLLVGPCHYPTILWLRVPDMLHAVFLLLSNLRRRCGKVLWDPFRGSTKIKVTAWIPVADASGDLPAPDEDAGQQYEVNRHGRWKIKKGEILLATSAKHVAMPGGMRVPYDMKDPDMVSPCMLRARTLPTVCIQPLAAGFADCLPRCANRARPVHLPPVACSFPRAHDNVIVALPM